MSEGESAKEEKQGKVTDREKTRNLEFRLCDKQARQSESLHRRTSSPSDSN